MPKMLSLMCLREVIEAIGACIDDNDVWQRYSWVYADGDGSVEGCQLYLSSPHDEGKEEPGEGDDRPGFAVSNNLYPFLEASTFAAVLQVQKRQKLDSTVHDYAKALDHYCHYDAFLGLTEPPGPASKNQEMPFKHLGFNIYREYDLLFEQCPSQHLPAMARAASEILRVPIGEALSLCRRPPVQLGQRVDGRISTRIEKRCYGLPLLVQIYVPFPWLDASRSGHR